MPKIQNFSSLAVSGLRRAGLQIVEAGLQSIDTQTVIKNLVQRDGDVITINGETIDLSTVDRLLVVGAGKCSLEAAVALEEILGEKISAGIVMDVRGGGDLKKIKALIGDHPYSTERNIDATGEIIQLLSHCKEKDLVLFIISGGGSALLCQPEYNTCEQEGEIIRALFQAGADIYKLNCIRKHLSKARGGYLASYAYPARSIALIFSDVPGDRLEWVSSGPTYRDSTTVQDARKILEEYDIEKKLGFAITLIETPKDEKFFSSVKNILACSATTALAAMEEKARELGFSPTIKTAPLQGEAREVGESIADEIAKQPAKAVLLYAGETTVTMSQNTGAGKGGRNLEAGLGALMGIKRGTLVITVASDGRDNTEFAGAVCDIMTKDIAKKCGASVETALAEHNSFDFFEKTGQYLMTGDTGSNVSDLFVALHE